MSIKNANEARTLANKPFDLDKAIEKAADMVYLQIAAAARKHQSGIRVMLLGFDARYVQNVAEILIESDFEVKEFGRGDEGEGWIEVSWGKGV